MPKNYRPRYVPFVEAYYKGGRQKPTAIIIKSSGTTSDRGAALTIAQSQHTVRSPHDTAHYVIDSETTYQCVPDDIIAGPSFHCAEPNAIVVKICMDWLDSLDEWNDLTHGRVLDRTVELVAHLVLAYKIQAAYPLDLVSEARWRRWKRRSRGGIILRIEGAWPTTTFMNDLHERIALLRSKN